MSKWIDFSSDERLVMIQNVAKSLNIDELAVEKDWWVTAVLQAVFRTKAAKYLLFKGGTSLSKGWDFINRFSEDVDLALNRTFFLKELGIQCANCNNKTQIHNLREKGQDYIYGTFKEELKKQLANLKLDVNILTEQEKLLDKMTYERWIVLNQYKIIKEKIYWREEYLKKDREFFEQLKRSEFKNESALTVLRKLKELYSSDKKSKE